MFCSECGTKNENGSLFCENCGNKLEPVKQEKKEVVKNNKIKIIIIAVAIVLVAAYLFVNSILKPEKIAEGYFEALVNYDSDKVYEYLDVDSSEFTTKKIFKQLTNVDEDSEKEKVEIVNYNIDKIEKSTDGMSVTITFKYLLEGQKDSNTYAVNLVKSKDKKWLLFDNWKINVNDYKIVKKYEFKMPEGSEFKLQGIKVDKKYLKETEDNIDTYVIPELFNLNYDIEVVMPNGITVEDSVKIIENNNYSLKFDANKLSDKDKKKLESAVKKSLENLYNNAKDKKAWDEVKSLFEYKNGDVSKVETAYGNLLSSFSNSSSTLDSIKFTKIEIRSVSMYDNGELYLSVKVTYDYSLSYQSGDETKTNNSDDYDYMYLTLDYSDDAFRLVNATSLNTYFSKYY